MSATLKTRVIVWIWNHTPTCVEISRLASRAQEQPLGWRMRLKMRLHFLICIWCKRYCQHLDWLHKTLPRFDEHTAELPVRGLSPEAKHRIVRRLKSDEKNSCKDYCFRPTNKGRNPPCRLVKPVGAANLKKHYELVNHID